MCKLKTLNELCKEIGVTRRAVQGYEKEDLVKPTEKNKYGYLLYDEEAQKRIAKIKKLQEFGFKRKEIKELLDAPNEEVKKDLERQVNKLQEELLRLESSIKEAQKLYKTL